MDILIGLPFLYSWKEGRQETAGNNTYILSVPSYLGTFLIALHILTLFILTITLRSMCSHYLDCSKGKAEA